MKNAKNSPIIFFKKYSIILLMAVSLFAHAEDDWVELDGAEFEIETETEIKATPKPKTPQQKPNKNKIQNQPQTITNTHVHIERENKAIYDNDEINIENLDNHFKSIYNISNREKSSSDITETKIIKQTNTANYKQINTNESNPDGWVDFETFVNTNENNYKSDVIKQTNRETVNQNINKKENNQAKSYQKKNNDITSETNDNDILDYDELELEENLLDQKASEVAQVGETDAELLDAINRGFLKPELIDYPIENQQKQQVVTQLIAKKTNSFDFTNFNLLVKSIIFIFTTLGLLKMILLFIQKNKVEQYDYQSITKRK